MEEEEKKEEENIANIGTLKENMSVSFVYAALSNEERVKNGCRQNVYFEVKWLQMNVLLYMLYITKIYSLWTNYNEGRLPLLLLISRS